MHLDAQSICNRGIADLGLLNYEDGLEAQATHVELRARGEIGDTLLLCEHPPIYTLGTNADAANVLRPGDIPVVQTDRGGEVTYHGPGQLVGYAICDLNERGRDLHKHCRDLEQVMMAALLKVDIVGERIEGRTGVWVNGRKIGAIGVRVRHWISSHGFALNVDCDLAPFEGIIPCGIADAAVTSIAHCGEDHRSEDHCIGRSVDMKPLIADAFREIYA